ncbi:MAG: deoxyribodipyrimidine photo-lyase [Verrucomicrobia bacterium]|nr:deoxyribodipyrimidine photo-lyase [Verrucomicrobiota bacterium]
MKPAQIKVPPAIVRFRQDLRLADNPALEAACRRGGPVVPVFVWAKEEEGAWPPGSASRWWLHQSLTRLAEEFRAAGTELIIRQGSSLAELLSVAKETGADTVVWNRRYEPAILARDRKIEESLRAAGLHTESHNAALLHEPWAIQNKAGRPFQVFTPFWRTCLAAAEPAEPRPAPRRLTSPTARPGSLPLAALGLEPKLNWTTGLRAAWQPGSVGAKAELERFLRDGVLTYSEGRNRPDLPGTSRLSPHLHFGEISPRQVWHAAKRFAETRAIPPAVWRHWQFLTEIGWREFAHHLIFHFPLTPEQPLRSEFARFPWRQNPAWLRAWQRGQTGYPLVDAGMRELWSTGWMHNRVRMVVASFLVKNLLIPWQEGARWFWDTLVDADLANNTLGWQWTAGCGADAAPFFRIFNPVSQGEKFDPEGNYVRRWVPELARLPGAWVHQPWQAPSAALASAGVRLDQTYPRPIVSHLVSREVALEAYQAVKQAPRNVGG